MIAQSDRGWIAPELILEDTLRMGYALLSDQIEAGTIDGFVQRIFSNAEFVKRQQIVKFFAETSIRIVENFPQDPKVFPCWAILLSADEQTQYVGDMGGPAIFENERNDTVTAEAWTTTLTVATLAEHPEVLQWLYQFAKWILSTQRRALGKRFGLMQRLAGRDLGFEQAYRPRFVYRRDLIWNVQYLQRDADSRSPAVIDSTESNATVSEAVGLLGGLDVGGLARL